MVNNHESATLRSSTILRDRKNKKLPVYNGGLGANPIRQHSSLIESLKKNSECKEYLPPTGLEILNKQINKIYSTDYALIGNGLKEMIFMLLLGIDCNVILVTPCWVSYIEQAKILKKDTIFIKTDISNNFKLTDVLLDSTLNQIENNKPNLLFLNNPTNPTGAVYSENELFKISVICQKYNIIVFSDEIYMDIVHNNIKTIQFNKLYKKTITGSSLSKNFGCGGYRVGWLAFTKELKELYEKLHIISSSVYSCASHSLQCVAYDALKYSNSIKKLLSKQKYIFSEIALLVYNKFNQIGLKTSIPEGGWYIFLDFNQFAKKFKKNNINNDEELCLKLINDIGLITVSGSSFGYYNKDCYYLRYSIVDLNFKNNNNCIENIEDFNLNYLSKNIIKGINELDKWLKTL